MSPEDLEVRKRAAARRTEDEPSLSEATEHVAAAARDVVRDSLALARLEAQQAAVRLTRGGALLTVAAVLAVGAWFGLMAAAGVLLSRWLAPGASIAIVAAANLLAAGLLGRAGLRRLREPVPPPEAP